MSADADDTRDDTGATGAAAGGAAGGGDDGAALTGETALAEFEALAPSQTPRPHARLQRKLGRVSRYPLVLLTLVFTVNVSHQLVLPGVFPLIKEEFRLSDTALGVLGSGYLIFASVFLVPFAILADRYSRTKIIAWASAGWGLLMIGLGAAGSYAQLLTVRLALGATDPAEQPTSYSLLTDYYPVEERGRVFGIWNIGQLLGVVLVPFAGGIADAFGWRAALYAFAIPGFVLAILVWRLQEPERGIQDRLHRQRQRQQADTTAADGADTPETSEDTTSTEDTEGTEDTGEGPVLPRMMSRAALTDALAGYLALVKIPTVLTALLGIGMVTFFTRGLGTWLAVFFVRFHDMSIAQATGTVAILALGALVGSIGGGYLSDHLESRGIRTARIRLAAISAILAALFLFPAFATDNTTLMLALFFPGAIFVFPPQPLLQAVMANVVHPHLRGRGASLDTLTQTILGASAIFIYGVLSDAVGLRTTLLSVIPTIAVAGILVWTLGGRFQTRDEDHMRDQLTTTT